MDCFKIIFKGNAYNILSLEAMLIAIHKPILNTQLGPGKGAQTSLSLYWNCVGFLKNAVNLFYIYLCVYCKLNRSHFVARIFWLFCCLNCCCVFYLYVFICNWRGVKSRETRLIINSGFLRTYILNPHLRGGCMWLVHQIK